MAAACGFPVATLPVPIAILVTSPISGVPIATSMDSSRIVCTHSSPIGPTGMIGAIWAASCALLLSPWVPVHAGLLKEDVDFSNYDAPLFQQIVNRIKAKIAARLRQGVNTQDRYFMVPFAYQDQGNKPGVCTLVHLGNTRARPRQTAQPDIGIQTRAIQERRL